MKAKFALVIALVIGASSLTLWADEIPPEEIIFEDPATLHIGGGFGDPCAAGCGGHPNLLPSYALGPTHIGVYQNQGGANTLRQPLLLVLAVANTTNPTLFSNASITNVTLYNNYNPATTGYTSSSTGTWSYGYSGSIYNWSGAAYNGAWTASSPELYSFLNFRGPTENSNNFGNVSGAVLNDLGITATKFGVYVFAINASLSAKGLLDIEFATGALPEGTFIIAYGQTPVLNKKVMIYDTPITEAGLTKEKVAEPGTLVMLGMGALALLRRRRK